MVPSVIILIRFAFFVLINPLLRVRRALSTWAEVGSTEYRGWPLLTFPQESAWAFVPQPPPSLLRMTVQCQPVLQSCTLRGTRTPSGPQGPPTLYAQPFRRGRSQARHLRSPEAAQGTAHSSGLGRTRWQLGPGLVRCVHTHACTQEHMHTCVYTHTHTHTPTGWWGETRRLGMLTPTATQLSHRPHGGGVINI